MVTQLVHKYLNSNINVYRIDIALLPEKLPIEYIFDLPIHKAILHFMKNGLHWRGVDNSLPHLFS